MGAVPLRRLLRDTRGVTTAEWMAVLVTLLLAALVLGRTEGATEATGQTFVSLIRTGSGLGSAEDGTSSPAGTFGGCSDAEPEQRGGRAGDGPGAATGSGTGGGTLGERQAAQRELLRQALANANPQSRFAMIDMLRRTGALADIVDEAALADRYAEGVMVGAGPLGEFTIPAYLAMSIPYEAAKYLGARSPMFNALLPEAFHYQAGVTSEATIRGTFDRTVQFTRGALRGYFSPSERQRYSESAGAMFRALFLP